MLEKPSSRDQSSHLPDQILGLDAVDRLLHVRVHVLHAERQAVEAGFAQGCQVLARQFARIDFAADFGIVGQGEILAHHRHQATNIVGIEVSGRAAAPVQLVRHALGIDQLRGTRHFAVERRQIGLGFAVVARRHHVAAAVVAKRIAERDVRIQRQPAIRRRCGQRLGPVGLAKPGMKIRCSGIRRVARTRHAVFLKQL